MDEQRQDAQLGPTYNSSVPIKDVALKTYRKRWMIERDGGRGSGRSVLIARHDGDDDNDVSVKDLLELIVGENPWPLEIFCVYFYERVLRVCECLYPHPLTQTRDLLKKFYASLSLKEKPFLVLSSGVYMAS